MPHIILDMDEAVDAMVGNASVDSSLCELKAAYHVVDGLIDNSTIEVSDQAHEYCDKASGFLLGVPEGHGFEPSGRGTAYDVQALIDEGETILA